MNEGRNFLGAQDYGNPRWSLSCLQQYASSWSLFTKSVKLFRCLHFGTECWKLSTQDINGSIVSLNKYNNRRINIPVFWIVSPRRFLYKLQTFGAACCLHCHRCPSSLLQYPEESVSELVKWQNVVCTQNTIHTWWLSRKIHNFLMPHTN